MVEARRKEVGRRFGRRNSSVSKVQIWNTPKLTRKSENTRGSQSILHIAAVLRIWRPEVVAISFRFTSGALQKEARAAQLAVRGGSAGGAGDIC